MSREVSKVELARSCDVSRSTLYYTSKQEAKDWHTKTMIETVLREYPSYGHKRIAIHLKINKKRVLHVMKKYGIKPYRRIPAKLYKKERKPGAVFPNATFKLLTQPLAQINPCFLIKNLVWCIPTKTLPRP